MKAALAAAAVVLLAGCGSSSPKVAATALPRLVLQPRDLPRTFEQFNSGAQVRADAPAGPRSDPTRFGREGGWIARYHRAGTAPGPLVVESRADLFSSPGGAKKDLAAYEQDFAKPIAVPRVGDASAGATQTLAGTRTVRFYVVAWRYGNVTASVTVDGFEGKLRPADAVALARRQQARIAAAAGR